MSVASTVAVVDRTEPARKGAAVTPSDTVDLTNLTRGVYVGAGGDLAVIFANDTASTTLVAVPTGVVLPIAVRRILSTGTTATSVVALY
jgi:hypothetical protein